MNTRMIHHTTDRRRDYFGIMPIKNSSIRFEKPPEKQARHNERQRKLLEAAEKEIKLVPQTYEPQKFLSGKIRHRGLYELDNDGILTLEFCERHKGKNRLSGLYQVLSTMPKADYEKLKSLGHVYFYLPTRQTLGSVNGFPGDAIYIYLSPQLEDMAADWVSHCVAHEIAHAVSGHVHTKSGPKEFLEAEANNKAKEWGFECPE